MELKWILSYYVMDLPTSRGSSKRTPAGALSMALGRVLIKILANAPEKAAPGALYPEL